MKNRNQVRRQSGANGASAQARSQSKKQAGSGLKTYRVFTAAAGETDMTKWQEGESIQARSPLAAARQQLGHFKRLALCRFNQGDKDFIFDLMKDGTTESVAPADAASPVHTGRRAPNPAWETWLRFESAIREVKSLHYVMCKVLDGAEEPGGEIVAGLQTLGWRTQEELASIFEAMRPWVSAERLAKGLPVLPAEGRAA